MSSNQYHIPWHAYATSGIQAVCPTSLAKPPQRWDKEDVAAWLRWCSEEYSIEPVSPDKFDMNGKAVCLLSRNDFMERVPKNGDVLFNCLQSLISKTFRGGVACHAAPQRQQTAPSSGRVPAFPSNQALSAVSTDTSIADAMPTGLLLISAANTPTTYSVASPGSKVIGSPILSIPPLAVPATSTLERRDLDCPDMILQNHDSNEGEHLSCDVENGMDSEGSSEDRSLGPSDHEQVDLPSLHRKQGSSDCRLLWEFIYQLLQKAEYSNCVCWENPGDYVFRINNPTGLAELWGQQKNRTNMTYEKLSRALRYYYRMNIIKKVPGKRLTYKFLQSPTTIQKGQRGAKPHSKLPLSNNVFQHGNEKAAYKIESENSVIPRETPPSPENYRDSDGCSPRPPVSVSVSPKRLLESAFRMPSGVAESTESVVHMPSPTMRPSSEAISIFPSGTANSPQIMEYQTANGHVGVDHGAITHSFTNQSAVPSIKVEQIYSDPRMTYYSGLVHFSQTERPGVIKPLAHSQGNNSHSLRLPFGCFHRSNSCDLSPSQRSRSPANDPYGRPGLPRSASPRAGLQTEPEDLSVRRGANSVPPSQDTVFKAAFSESSSGSWTGKVEDS